MIAFTITVETQQCCVSTMKLKCRPASVQTQHCCVCTLILIRLLLNSVINFLCYTFSMPTILIVGSYRFFFYSSDAVEPPHIHVRSGDSSAKFWINPARLQSSKGFNQHQIRTLLKLVEKHTAFFERKWHEYFNS